MDRQILAIAKRELAPFRVLLFLSWVALLLILAFLHIFGYLDSSTLLLAAFGCVWLAYWGYCLQTREIRRDLACGTIDFIEIEEPYQVKKGKEYEAGSASFYIPILGNLFPKLWGPEMRLRDEYVLELPNGKQYFVLHRGGDKPYLVKMRYSEISLGVVLR